MKLIENCLLPEPVKADALLKTNVVFYVLN